MATNLTLQLSVNVFQCLQNGKNGAIAAREGNLIVFGGETSRRCNDAHNIINEMFNQSHPFITSFSSISAIDSFTAENKWPLLCAPSLCSLGQCSVEVELLRDKYEREYNKFHRVHHQRSKSQMDKIERVIKHVNDLNNILDSDAGNCSHRNSKITRMKCHEDAQILAVPLAPAPQQSAKYNRRTRA